jgi:hypothetical protein
VKHRNKYRKARICRKGQVRWVLLLWWNMCSILGSYTGIQDLCYTYTYIYIYIYIYRGCFSLLLSLST